MPRYDQALKDKAVAQALEAGNIKKTAAEYGVSWQTLKSWMGNSESAEAKAPAKKTRKATAKAVPSTAAFDEGLHNEASPSIKGLANEVIATLESGDAKDEMINQQREEIKTLKATIANLKKMLKAIVDQA